MPPQNSRTPPFDAGWQQASAVNKSRRQYSSNTVRPTQPMPAGFKAQPNPTVASYPVHEVEDPGDNTHATSFDDHFPHNTVSQVDALGLHAAAESSSQYLYGNYLTPDQGSDNPFSEHSSYNSPSLDDFIWQETYSSSQNLDDFGNDGTLVPNIFNDIDQSGDLQGIVAKEVSPTSVETRSLTPRMSTTTTTTTTTHSPMHPRAISPHLISKDMNVQQSKRTYTPEDDEDPSTDRFSRPMSSQQARDVAGQYASHTAQPTFVVSTYNRGDSPARTELPLARSLSKRSQASRLSEHTQTVSAQDDEPIDPLASGSRLMPPDHYEDTHWSNDDDIDNDEVEAPGRAGVAPSNRNTDTVPSLNDMEKQRELDETRAGVENWLATSETGSPIAPTFQRNRSRRERIRSRSTGARTERVTPQGFSDKHVLGPGVLLDVDSADDYSDEGSSYVSSNEHGEGSPPSPPAQITTIDPGSQESYFSRIDEDNIAPDEAEPLPRQFYRRQPYQDGPRYSGPVDSRNLPPTSNHAIMQFDQQNSRFETASRAATWGTRRRTSDSEIASVIDGDKVRHLSLSQKTRDRGNSIFNRARTVMRRSSSNIKKSKEHVHRQSTPPEAERHTSIDNDQGHAATSPIQQVQRQFSWGKSKSPPPPPPTATSSALMAITGHLTAVGGSSLGASAGIEPPERPKSPFLGVLKRSRSRSDIPKTSKNAGGLADLFNRHGGPPVPTLASPLQMRAELQETNQVAANAGSGEDDMEEDNEDDVPVKMELPVQSDNIIPNLDGFRTHAKHLNPRLEPYLVERIAQDQLRRYKKLVKTKIDHTRSVQLNQQCPSGVSFCKDLGGKPKILPPRTSAKDTNVNYAQFKVGNGGESDGEESAFVDGGVVTPALFPQGIPLPPATHLPAEFECPLCFQVKKFQKPSDWTKHVHEDVQPFSCTFPNCPEPKSFKRKADWVRHENERHRHLGWWRCSIQDCAHVCYRKDNFVQHLVREHKMNEPKSKNQKPTGNRARPGARAVSGLGHDSDDFWQLVEHCRHDTSQTPRNEPCKFCGNVCNTWKKLSVHVGKHMEQIAMPVLDLVAKRAITPDTAISPIDPPNHRTTAATTLDAALLNGNGYDALSPYATSVSVYHSSSAGQSPAPMNPVQVHSGNVGQSFYDQGVISNGVQQMQGNMQAFGGPNVMPQSYPYPTYEVVNSTNFVPLQHQTAVFTQQSITPNVAAPYHSHQVPRSQPMDAGYGNLNVDTSQASFYSHDNYYPNSAPSNSFMSGYGNGVGHEDGLHSPHTGHGSHMHSPANNQPNGNEYLFPRQQNRSNGGHYY